MMIFSSTELQEIPGFLSLRPDTLMILTERAFLQSKRPGDTIVVEGLPTEFCYFIQSGTVRVLRMNLEGRIQVLNRFGPGSPLNIISMLSDQKTNRSSIESLTAVKLITLDRACFDLLMEQHPDFSKFLLRIFAERMTKMVNLASDLSLRTVRTRLARFLMELADTPQAAGGWTQDEIAAYIGTVRDVVGRLLREFQADGLIQRDRQQILLLDRQRLASEANFTYRS